MSDDIDHLFDNMETAEPTPEPEPKAEPAAAPQPDPAQAATPVPEGMAPTGDDNAAPPVAEPKDDARHVPYEALKDERTKRQAAEREIQEMRRWRADMEARARQAQIANIPDPDQRLEAERQQMRQAMISERVETSRQRAVRQHGDDFVAQVVELFNDPKHAPMSHQFLSDPEPFEMAVDYYRRVKAFEEIGNDPDAYKARIRAELAAEISSAKPTPPPPSMAGATAQGRNSDAVVSGFDALFGS